MLSSWLVFRKFIESKILDFHEIRVGPLFAHFVESQHGVLFRLALTVLSSELNVLLRITEGVYLGHDA